MKSLEANGIVIGYDSFGDDDDDTVLLISGLGAQRIRWTESFCQKFVKRGFRVIHFDNRDAGLSTHFSDYPAPDFSALANAMAAGQQPSVPYTLHDMVADAIGLMDALSIQQAHVVGRSMGGMIAQLMASDHPQRVLSLTSIMSSTGNPQLPATAPDVMAMLTKRAPHPVEDQEGFIAHGLAFARRITGSGFAFDEQAQRTILLEEVSRAYDPAGFARQIAAIAATGDIRPRLAHILAPTLVVHGADDVLISPICGEDTAKCISNSDFLLVDGMGHDLPAAPYPMVVEAILQNVDRHKRKSQVQRLSCVAESAMACDVAAKVPIR